MQSDLDIDIVKPTGRVLARGILWTGVFRWSAQVLSWAATLVVIRILAPDEYGIAGLALATLAVATVLSEFGLGTALVALPHISRREVAQLNSAALLLAAAVGGLLVLSAPFIAKFYGEPALRSVLPTLMLVFLAEGARLVPVALLARRLEYRTRAFLDFSRSVVTAGVVLTLAIAGKGYWALIIGNIAGVVLTTIWIMIRYGQPFAWPRLMELRTPIRFSRDILISRLSWVIYKNSDFFVAGRLFGSSMLGFYTVAWTVAMLPGEKLGNVLTASTAPFFAAIQRDRAALGRYFLRVTEALALVLFPLLFGFVCVSDLAVSVVLGERWLTAVPPLVVLVIYAAVQNVNTPVSQILNVTENLRTNVRANLIALAILPPAFFVGGKLGGINGVAVAWLVVHPMIMALPLTVALRSLNLRFRSYLQTFRFATEGTLVMLVAVGAVRALPWTNSLRIYELGAAIAIGALAYVGTIWVRRRILFVTLTLLLRGKVSGEEFTS